MKPIIGEYYRDFTENPNGGETIQVKKFKFGRVCSRIILDPNKVWHTKETTCSLKNFFEYYKHIKYFNTPLYKVINS